MGADQEEGASGEEIKHRRTAIGRRGGKAAQNPAEPWPENGAGLPGQRAPGYGARQDPLGHHHRAHRGLGGGLKGADGPKAGGDGENRDQGRRRLDGQKGEARDEDKLGPDADEGNLLAVEMVRRRPGDEGEREQRHELGQTHHADQKGAFLDGLGQPRHLIDLPAQGHRLDHDGEGGKKPRGQKQAVIAVLGGPKSGQLRRGGGHPREHGPPR